MFRTALIAFALSLALAVCVQEPIRAEGEGGNQQDQHAQNPPAQDVRADDTVPNQFAAVICADVAAPGTMPKFRTIPIGPGQKPADLCRNSHLQPVAFIPRPPVNGEYHWPVFNDIPPPANGRTTGHPP